MIVADASILVEALCGGGSRADHIRDRISDAPQLHVPHVADLEITKAFRRLSARGLLGEGLATSAIAQLRRLPLTRYPHVPFLDRIWELRSAITPYDAAYVALAEAVGVPLITLDARLASAPGLVCRVEVIA